jgi:hypothetical protein
MRSRILCALSLTPLIAGVSCASDNAEERQVDTAVAESGCSQAGRADDIVKKTAIAEFQQFGKSCEPYEVTTYPQNERETVWRVCCGGSGLNFIFFPAKCVAHRASSLIDCKE